MSHEASAVSSNQSRGVGSLTLPGAAPTPSFRGWMVFVLLLWVLISQSDARPALVYKGDGKLNCLVLPKPFKHFSAKGTELDAYRAAKRFVRARLPDGMVAAFSDYASSEVEPVLKTPDAFTVNGSYGQIQANNNVVEVNWTAQVYYDRAEDLWYLQKLGFGAAQTTVPTANTPAAAFE